MRAWLLPLLVAIPAAGAYLIGVARLGCRPGSLLPAIRRLLEVAGLVLVFAAAHVAIGLPLVVALRLLTGQFLSVYIVIDNAWWLWWSAQALVFQWWWRSA